MPGATNAGLMLLLIGLLGAPAVEAAENKVFALGEDGKELKMNPKAPGRTVKVAGIVLKWVNKDPPALDTQLQANYSRAEPLIREAATNGAKIVCTTESFLDGYSATYKTMPLEKFHSLAQKIPGGEYTTKLQKLADELDIHLIAGILELDGDKTYNSAILIGPDGQIIGKHRKKVIQWESYRNTPGDAFNAFPTPYGKIGMMICADRTEKATIVELTKNGAALVFCPSGGLWGESNDKMMQQRSKEGKVPIVFVHPCQFLVTSAAGEILYESAFGKLSKEPKDPKSYQGGVVKYFDLELKPGA